MTRKRALPTRDGFFGEFGGKFVPETLMAPLAELEAGYGAARRDRAFRRELDDLLRDYVGRPTPLTEAPRFAAACGAFRLFLKREDLNHTGAHKINNALGQALLAKRMGKARIIAETGAGQHGVATATACALLGLRCRVYMGEVDIARQAPNVHRMRLLGAEVVAVASGSRTLKDAINEAIRDWVTNVADTHYVIGSVLGPHPYPMMVRDFQSVIGREAAAQVRKRTGALPDVAVACVGGGSNSIGLFHELLRHESVRLIGVEAGGRSLAPGEHAARFAGGAPGVLHGTRSLLLQDADGQIGATHSVSAGLDYPSVGPELAHLGAEGRIEITSCGDAAALAAFHRLSATEGIIPALESAHALGYLLEHGREIPAGSVVVVNLSGRGDKDVPQVVEMGEPALATNVVPSPAPRRLAEPVPRSAKRDEGLGMTAARPPRKRRIANAFASMKREGRCGLVAYLTCGETGVEGTIDIALALAEAGADVLELGVPFSDPIADGPVIQAAAQRALERGTTIEDVMAIAAGIRASSEVPLVAFSYLNPILKYGEERFAERARAAGFDGVLVTDLPPESGSRFCLTLRASGLDPVFLVAPTSTPARIRLADRMSRGFVYCVSTSGVTGARRELDPSLLGRLDGLRPAVTNPIAVGFGVATHEHYRALAPRCDAVVVGSAIVRAIGEGDPAGAPARAGAVVRQILGVPADALAHASSKG